jgi:ADP-ribosylglycohydrolase
MSIAPIGIVNAGNPTQAYQDGFNIASVNQDGHNRDGAATWAAGVAAAFIPGITLVEILEIMTQHTSYLMRRAIDLTMDLAYTSDTVDDFAEKYYARMLDWSWPIPPNQAWNKEHYFSGNTIELVPITMAILHLCQGDVHQSMIEAASFGRDCDTTASMAGQIAGAMVGASAVRQDWVDIVEKANQDFFEEVDGDPTANFYRMAQRLVEALKNEQQAAQQRANHLVEILGSYSQFEI